MDYPPKPELVNPETTGRHQVQFQQQILLPILAGALILLALGVLASTAGTDRPAVWANISVIFMAVVFGLGGLFSLLLVVALIMGTNWVLRKLPPKSYLAQYYTAYAGQLLTGFFDKLTRPVIQAKSGWAGVASPFTKSKQKAKEE